MGPGPIPAWPAPAARGCPRARRSPAARGRHSGRVAGRRAPALPRRAGGVDIAAASARVVAGAGVRTDPHLAPHAHRAAFPPRRSRLGASKGAGPRWGRSMPPDATHGIEGGAPEIMDLIPRRATPGGLRSGQPAPSPPGNVALPPCAPLGMAGSALEFARGGCRGRSARCRPPENPVERSSTTARLPDASVAVVGAPRHCLSVSPARGHDADERRDWPRGPGCRHPRARDGGVAVIFRTRCKATRRINSSRSGLDGSFGRNPCRSPSPGPIESSRKPRSFPARGPFREAPVLAGLPSPEGVERRRPRADA